MSADAERYVETLQVKGSARELLRTIAKNVPEGQTTTPPMTTDELAGPAQQSEKTVRRNRDALDAKDVIRVHDGGRGNVARYEILNLAGERPATAAPLPLLGRPKPPRTKEVRKTLVTMTNLFDETSVKVTNVRAYTIGHFVQTLVTLTNLVMLALENVGQNVRRLLPPWLWLARARDVLQLETTTTTAAPRDGPPTTDEIRFPARAPVHPWHAWCDGRVHVPKELHQELLAKLGRFPNESAAAQEARLRAFYVQTCAALPPYEPIGVSEFTFWNRAFTATFASPAARAGNRAPPPRESRAAPTQDELDEARRQIEQRLGPDWRKSG